MSIYKYGTKFSRHIIFVVIVDLFQTTKSKLIKCFPQNVIKLAPLFCDLSVFEMAVYRYFKMTNTKLLDPLAQKTVPSTISET